MTRAEMLPPHAPQARMPATGVPDLLAPPQRWLDALVRGDYSWPFFRLRYKHLLRQRCHARASAFFELAHRLHQGQAVLADCGCGETCQPGCHRALAADFLRSLRDWPAYRQWQPTGAERPAPPRSRPLAPGLNGLIEHPRHALQRAAG